MNQRKVLIVDDEKNFADLLGKEIARMGFATEVRYDSDSALDLLEDQDFDVVLLDIKMPGRDGIETLREMKKRRHTHEVIMLTGHATLDNALEAMKIGAYDYLTKPCKLEELGVLLDKAVEKGEALRENQTLRQILSSGASDTKIIGMSVGMQKIMDKLDKIAEATDVSVLITGESGTGKELIAREIHRRSPISEAPFVPINCAVLQSAILESELFGHEKGSFTGATSRKLGLFEVARGGTVFLDEIGETEETIQAKLLRFIQFGEFRRVGGNENLNVKLRIIAATNRDLAKEIEAGRFRDDLFYRLNVVQVEVPSLRERPEDILPLAGHFLQRYRGNRNQKFTFSPQAQALLTNYTWPGNVRELENFVRRLMIFQENAVIEGREVEDCFGTQKESIDGPASLVLEDVVRDHLLKVLRLNTGNKARTADALGIALKTLYNKLNSYKEQGLYSA